MRTTGPTFRGSLRPLQMCHKGANHFFCGLMGNGPPFCPHGRNLLDNMMSLILHTTFFTQLLLGIPAGTGWGNPCGGSKCPGVPFAPIHLQ